MKADNRYLRDLEKQGFTVTLGGRGHWKIYDGPRLITTHASSAGGHRGLLNLQACIKRYLRMKATA